MQLQQHGKVSRHILIKKI